MSFDSQPILRSELIELRPLQPEDFSDLYAVASDPLVWQQHPAADRYREPVFRSFFQEAMDSGGALLAIDADTGCTIGSSRFHGFDAASREVEIGWTFLARSHWGGVFNGEMKRLMVEHAFVYVDSVVFLIGPENHRSQRAAEKIGAVRDGSRPDDTGQESYVYRLRGKR